MNGVFLKRIFACEQFSQDYRHFLCYYGFIQSTLELSLLKTMKRKSIIQRIQWNKFQAKVKYRRFKKSNGCLGQNLFYSKYIIQLWLWPIHRINPQLAGVVVLQNDQHCCVACIYHLQLLINLFSYILKERQQTLNNQKLKKMYSIFNISLMFIIKRQMNLCLSFIFEIEK